MLSNMLLPSYFSDCGVEDPAWKRGAWAVIQNAARSAHPLGQLELVRIFTDFQLPSEVLIMENEADIAYTKRGLAVFVSALQNISVCWWRSRRWR